MDIQKDFGKQITENYANFMFAGNAIFTIKSLKTGKHYTYQLNKGQKYFFVTVRHGDEWSEIGSIRISDLREFPNWGSSTFAPSMKALIWFIAHLDTRLVEFYHMGRCAACARPLTNPESIETGYGPICRERIFG